MTGFDEMGFDEMRTTPRFVRTALAAVLFATGLATPALAQDATVQELRIRQLESQVRELLRTSGTSAATAPGSPGSSPSTEMLARMDALEAQVARLTAQNEEISNRLRQLQSAPAASAAPTVAAPTQLAPATAPASAPTASAPSANSANLAAMGAAPVTPARPAAAPSPSPAPTKPDAKRVAAVKAIVKPQTGDSGDDEYSYGFRLWQAGFYPEAAQQLKLFLDKYPKHMRSSQGRNLLGRALLDDGKPREAAPWFLQNYKSDPSGNRAGDSLLNLADAMRQIGDTSRACIALNEFATNYPADAKGRLRADYDKIKGAVTCN